MMSESSTRELSRKERERLAHRLEMLEAAERVFIRKGFHATTVEEIAQEAEFAVGTIYNFFDSKEGLYHEVIERFARDFVKAFEDNVMSTTDPQQALETLIDLRLGHFAAHRDFFRVFLETSPGSRLDPAAALSAACAELYDNYIESVSDLFSQYAKGGPLEGTDPLFLALGFEGIINAFAAYWTRREWPEPLPEHIERLKQALLGWFRRGYFERAKP